jgi:hypothetical protein
MSNMQMQIYIFLLVLILIILLSYIICFAKKCNYIGGGAKKPHRPKAAPFTKKLHKIKAAAMQWQTPQPAAAMPTQWQHKIKAIPTQWQTPQPKIKAAAMQWPAMPTQWPQWPTYRLVGDHIYYQYIREKLNLLGWKELHNGQHVDFAYITPHVCMLTNKSHYRKQFAPVKANLKSTLANVIALGHKDSLAKLMKDSPYIPITDNLKDYIYKDDDVVIVKEVLASQQKGIYIIISKHNFLKVKKELMHESAIVSKYIKNPLLFGGKKFHLRVMTTVFVSKNNEKKLVYMKDNINIWPARKKYIINKKEDYLDQDMNITGPATTEKVYKWPTDFLQNSSQSIISIYLLIMIIVLV